MPSPTKIIAWLESIQLPAMTSITGYCGPSPSTLLLGPCIYLLWWSLASRSACKKVGSSRRHAKPSLKSQGQVGEASGRVSFCQWKISARSPSSCQFIQPRWSTLTPGAQGHTEMCHFPETQPPSRWRSWLPVRYSFRGERNRLKNMPLSSLMKLYQCVCASFLQSK